jgi:hypothetical protein
MFCAMGPCDREDILDLTFDVTVGPDTLYYIPPYFAHSVETTKGLSILFNYRAFDFKRMFKNHPWTAIHTVLSGLNYKLFFNHMDPEEVAYYYFNGEESESVISAPTTYKNYEEQDTFVDMISRIFKIFEPVDKDF